MTYRPFTCNQCGTALSQSEVASEHKVSIEGTAGTRNRAVIRSCRDCHAAGEYKQHQARLSAQAELVADILADPDISQEQKDRVIARMGGRS